MALIQQHFDRPNPLIVGLVLLAAGGRSWAQSLPVAGDAGGARTPPRTLVPIVATVRLGISRGPVADAFAESTRAQLEVRANGDVLFDGELRAHLTPDTLSSVDGERLTIAPNGWVTRHETPRSRPERRVARLRPDGTVDGDDGFLRFHFAIHGASASFDQAFDCVPNQLARSDQLPPEAYWTAGLLILAWHELPWRSPDDSDMWLGPVIRCAIHMLVELHASRPRPPAR